MVREVHQVRLNKAIVSQTAAKKTMQKRKHQLVVAVEVAHKAKVQAHEAEQKVIESEKEKVKIVHKWNVEIKHRRAEQRALAVSMRKAFVAKTRAEVHVR